MSKIPVYQIKKFSCKSDENDLYINDFKSHLLNNTFIENSHSHNFYLLVLFTKGTGVHIIDFDKFEIKPGCIYILKPGQVHSWQLSNDIDGYIAFYSQEIYNLYFGQKKIDDYSFYRTLKNSPEIILNELQILEIERYFEYLIYENNKNEFKKFDKLLNFIDIIHIELARIYSSNNEHIIHPYNIKINQLGILVNEYFKQEKLACFYADKMNISIKHLNRICKNVLDVTLTEFIYSKIILESKKLLSSNSMTISEIAFELGFEDNSYFTKVFKKHTGVTPLNFKKQLTF